MASSASPFERLGGHAGVLALVNAFYDLIERDSAYIELRRMHAADLAPMRDALAGFLTGWTGGPRDWFDRNPGKCMMSLHADLPITGVTATQWLTAMTAAVETAQVDPELAQTINDAFRRMANAMTRVTN